jgi:hypothetical protein
LDERIDGFRFGLENILGKPAASVVIPEEMGPRKDGPGGPFVPAGLGLNSGVGMGTGFNANGAAHGNGPGVGITISPQQQQQQRQGRAQGMIGPTFDMGVRTLSPMAAQQNQDPIAKASLAHSMV